MTSLIARIRSLWRGIRQGAAIEDEMEDEFRHHIDLRAADLMRSGVEPSEALRRARLEFGPTERHKENARVARGLQPINDLRTSYIDLKLGFRMLVRYPALALIGGLSIAFAIVVGASAFEIINRTIFTRTLFHEVDGMVGFRVLNLQEASRELPSVADLTYWQEELETVGNVGGIASSWQMLNTGRESRPVQVVEISPVAFKILRHGMLLGRPLSAEDEREGAPAVAVLSEDLWKQRFSSDRTVLGRTVMLGRTEATIVGVLPEEFNDHSTGLWAPLRYRSAGTEKEQGPPVQVFGQLENGASLENARAELSVVSDRRARELPELYGFRRPEVMEHSASLIDQPPVGFLFYGNVLGIAFLFLICGNVGLLLFARTATRASELTTRVALGASRRRILVQLFAEALILSGVGAAVGLVAAGRVLKWAGGEIFGDYLDLSSIGIAPSTAIYTVLLAVCAAVVAGVMPALKLTSTDLEGRLRGGAAGAGGPKLGRRWGTLIVGQIVFTVVFPAAAFVVGSAYLDYRAADRRFASGEYLSFRLEIPRETLADPHADFSPEAARRRAEGVYVNLRDRLLEEPGVRGVTFASRLPLAGDATIFVELDGAPPRPPDYDGGYRIKSGVVDVDYFDVMGADIIAGRGFDSADPGSDHPVVVVNQAFVDHVMEGQNPVGRRVRSESLRYADGSQQAAGTGEWFEIVGVVETLPMSATDGLGDRGLYRPSGPGSIQPLSVAIHLNGDPQSFGPTLRAIARDVNPAVRVEEITPLDEILSNDLKLMKLGSQVLFGAGAIGVFLSLAGIYSIMSLAVSSRTREIGVRTALGAQPRQILTSVFRKPLAQVSLGIVIGACILILLPVIGGAYDGEVPTVGQVARFAAYLGLLVGICSLACIVPSHRAMRVQPVDAMRGDAG